MSARRGLGMTGRPPPNKTPADIKARVLQMLVEGITRRDVAAMVGVKYATVCKFGRALAENEEPPRPAPVVERIARRCLCCGREFDAHGRFIRLCIRCKEIEGATA